MLDVLTDKRCGWPTLIIADLHTWKGLLGLSTSPDDEYHAAILREALAIAHAAPHNWKCRVTRACTRARTLRSDSSNNELLLAALSSVEGGSDGRVAWRPEAQTHVTAFIWTFCEGKFHTGRAWHDHRRRVHGLKHGAIRYAVIGRCRACLTLWTTCSTANPHASDS